MSYWHGLFAFELRWGGGEFKFSIGWFWIAAIAALIWWAAP